MFVKNVGNAILNHAGFRGHSDYIKSICRPQKLHLSEPNNPHQDVELSIIWLQAKGELKPNHTFLTDKFYEMQHIILLIPVSN